MSIVEQTRAVTVAARNKLAELRRELADAAPDASLESLREKVAAATRALEVAERQQLISKDTQSLFGATRKNDEVIGVLAVELPPGTSKQEREATIDAVLVPMLDELCDREGLLLGAAPARYVRERPGRDEEGRTILDVDGLIQGDVIVPAVKRGQTARPNQPSGRRRQGRKR